MKNVSSYTEYQAELRRNIETLENILDPSKPTEYPYLALRLRRYSLGWRLDKILRYCAEYEQDEEEKRFVSYDSEYGRGYEVPMSYGYLSKLDGSSKEVWWRNINYLCVLGLIYRHKPDTDAKRNTPAQNWSYLHAFEKSFSDEAGIEYKPDSWYSFPRYADSVLREADRRAELLKDVGTSRLSKNVARDILGEHVANTAYGNGFPMSSRTEKQRKVLFETLQEMVSAKGYAYPVDLINLARMNSPYSNSQLRKAYVEYRDKLFEELNCEYVPTGDAEREAYGLIGKTWIIKPRDKRENI